MGFFFCCCNGAGGGDPPEECDKCSGGLVQTYDVVLSTGILGGFSVGDCDLRLAGTYAGLPRHPSLSCFFEKSFLITDPCAFGGTGTVTASLNIINGGGTFGGTASDYLAQGSIRYVSSGSNMLARYVKNYGTTKPDCASFNNEQLTFHSQINSGLNDCCDFLGTNLKVTANL